MIFFRKKSYFLILTYKKRNFCKNIKKFKLSHKIMNFYFKTPITYVFITRRVQTTVYFKVLVSEINILFAEFDYLLPFENGTFGCIFCSQSTKQSFL